MSPPPPIAVQAIDIVSRHRGHVTAATKFGMRLSLTGSLLKPLQTAARRVVGMFPGLRKQLRRRRVDARGIVRNILDGDRAPERTDSIAAPGAEAEGWTNALKGTAQFSCRDQALCDKPLRLDAATDATRNSTLFHFVGRSRFPFLIN